jgi:methylmalonyl-CoA/ethylmalonyl-CoA epimerase
MIVDHIAYRVKNRIAAVARHIQLGYKEVTVFVIDFEDGTQATCSVMEPLNGPEVFISQGTPGSIVDRWVDARGGVGAVHHVAYGVTNVQETMDELQAQGIQFLSEEPLTCPGLVQVFTKPDPATGLIYEYIERHSAHGFCKENVKDLMESTDDN